MDKEKKHKPKKKIIEKKITENKEIGEEVFPNSQQKNAEKGHETMPACAEIHFSEEKKCTTEIQVENWGETKENNRNAADGFYIAHPGNIKRTAHLKDVHSKKLSELLEAFHMFDFDRDGVINHDDLKKTFSSLCVEVEDEEVEDMLSESLNPLNFDAFVILLGYKTLDLDPEEVLLDAFSNWDDHQEGLIQYERLKQNIMAWGDKFTKEEATAALADAPIILNKTKEKMIDYIQFSEDLCGLRKMMQRKVNEEKNNKSIL